MRVLIPALLAASAAFSQNASAPAATQGRQNPLVNSSHGMYQVVKGDLLKTADMVPDDKYAYRPTDEVRTMGQILAHVADTQFMLCGIVKDGNPQQKGFEKSAKTKAEIGKALNDSFAYCESAYAALNDADAATIVPFLGGSKVTKLAILDFNFAHDFEHYGNLVTYMRLNHMVPPSSGQP